jgi:outer membrane lipoprotein SlyB
MSSRPPEILMNRSILLSSLLAIGLSSGLATDVTARDRYDRDGYSYDSRYERCRNCGTVERIDIARYGERRAGGGGAVAGAIIGAALGNQVGSGDGRKAATVAGAIAGGVAGNNLEKRRNDRDTYAVHVRMDDGRRLVFEQRNLRGVREGARVKIRNGDAHLL